MLGTHTSQSQLNPTTLMSAPTKKTLVFHATPISMAFNGLFVPQETYPPPHWNAGQRRSSTHLICPIHQADSTCTEAATDKVSKYSPHRRLFEDASKFLVRLF